MGVEIHLLSTQENGAQKLTCYFISANLTTEPKMQKFKSSKTKNTNTHTITPISLFVKIYKRNLLQQLIRVH